MVLEIAERQQDLRDVHIVFVAHLFVGVEQRRHTARCGRLLVAHAGRFGGFAHRAQTERDRAAAAKDHVDSPLAQTRDVFEQPLHETETRCQAIGICNQRRADFDNDIVCFSHNITSRIGEQC